MKKLIKISFVFFAVITLSFTNVNIGAETTNIVTIPVIATELPPAPEPVAAPVPVVEGKIGEKIDNYLHQLDRQKNFNGVVLVSQNGKVIYKNAIGYADPKSKKELNLNDPFQLASVSKQFTAVAIMMLKEQGKLNYDDDVKKYFPEFPYSGITIRHLLTHRSGLPNYMYFADRYWKNKSIAMSNQDVIDLMAKHKPRVYFKPNRRYKYSNTGYSVLASIVEKASGQTFEAYMKNKVFKPLGMNNTFIYSKVNSSTVNIKNAVDGYAYRRKRGLSKVPNDYMNGVVGDKGVYSTVDDLFKWDQALYTDKLICKSTKNEAFCCGSKELRKHNYGFGWRIINGKNEDKKMVYHAGWWRGFQTYFLRDIQTNTTVIVLSNVQKGSFKTKKKGLLAILYPGKDIL